MSCKRTEKKGSADGISGLFLRFFFVSILQFPDPKSVELHNEL